MLFTSPYLSLQIGSSDQSEVESRTHLECKGDQRCSWLTCIELESAVKDIIGSSFSKK